MDDRRKLKRRHLIYYLRVFDRITGQLLGHLVDITPEGVMLMSEDEKPLDVIYQMKMVLPDEMVQKHPLEFDALSLWCSQDINPDFYDTGFRLLTIEPQDEELIKRLIDEYGFRD